MSIRRCFKFFTEGTRPLTTELLRSGVETANRAVLGDGGAIKHRLRPLKLPSFIIKYIINILD